MSKPQTDYDPRQAVLDQLAQAYEAWAEEEQLLVGQGKIAEAEGAHVMALRVLRAYNAEDLNEVPKPR